MTGIGLLPWLSTGLLRVRGRYGELCPRGPSYHKNPRPSPCVISSTECSSCLVHIRDVWPNNAWPLRLPFLAPRYRQWWLKVVSSLSRHMSQRDYIPQRKPGSSGGWDCMDVRACYPYVCFFSRKD